LHSTSLYYQKTRLTLKNGSCGFPIIIVEQFAQALAASDTSFGLQRTKFWPDELVDWQAHIAIPFFFGFARVFGQYGVRVVMSEAWRDWEQLEQGKDSPKTSRAKKWSTWQ
jgi:hypothetical protein